MNEESLTYIKEKKHDLAILMNNIHFPSLGLQMCHYSTTVAPTPSTPRLLLHSQIPISRAKGKSKEANNPASN